MATAAEGAGGGRFALVVATGTYADPTLAKLRAPGRDASELAAVLEDTAVGGFEVEMVLDAPAELLRRRVAKFCAQVGPGDLALVYLSCHGVLDDRGRLYYATVDTDRELLAATAVSSAWLNEQLEDCRSRRQILMLDCCHSGAFARGAKGEGSLALRERFEGRGRVILTGSRGTEYSFERGRVVGDSVSSVFTGALVEGLRSGEADRDGDGMITVSELYDYAYERVRTKEARQTPTLWAYGAEGDLLVAHSPRGAIVEPAPLPEDLAMLLESARSRVRESAVTELADLLSGPDAGRSLTARAELERIASEDVPSVAAAARAALDAGPVPAEPLPSQPPPPPTPPPPPPGAAPPPRKGPPAPHRRRGVAIAAGGIAVAVIAVAVAVALLGSGEAQSSEAGTFRVPESPRGIAVDGGTAWVASHGAKTVTRISPARNRDPIKVRPNPGKVAAGEGSVWVSVRNGEGLDRIDPDSKEVTKRVNVEHRVTQLAIDDGALWVSSEDAHTITKLDLSTGTEVWEEPYVVGERFEGIFAVEEEIIWAAVPGDGDSPEPAVIRIDGGSQEEIKPIPFKKGSFLNAIADGNGKVWVADAGDNVVVAFEADSGKRLGVANLTEAGISGDGLAVAEDTVLAWNPDAGLLTRIDPETADAEKPDQIDQFPKENGENEEGSDLAVDDGFAWVTSPANNTVFKCRISDPTRCGSP